MNSVHLRQVSPETKAPLKDSVGVLKHPHDSSLSVFYSSVEVFLENTESSVGEVYAYYAVEGEEGYPDNCLPPGMVVVKDGFRLQLIGYIKVTRLGWVWLDSI